MIKFWLFFVYGEIESSFFVCFVLLVWSYPTALPDFSPIKLPWSLCQKANDHMWCWFISGLSILFHYLSIFTLKKQYLNYSSFTIIFETRYCASLRVKFNIQGHTGKQVAEAGFKPRWSNLSVHILTVFFYKAVLTVWGPVHFL